MFVLCRGTCRQQDGACIITDVRNTRNARCLYQKYNRMQSRHQPTQCQGKGYGPVHMLWGVLMQLDACRHTGWRLLHRKGCTLTGPRTICSMLPSSGLANVSCRSLLTCAMPFCIVGLGHAAAIHVLGPAAEIALFLRITSTMNDRVWCTSWK